MKRIFVGAGLVPARVPANAEGRAGTRPAPTEKGPAIHSIWLTHPTNAFPDNVDTVMRGHSPSKTGVKRPNVPRVHVTSLRGKAWMAGIADKFTQSAQA